MSSQKKTKEKLIDEVDDIWDNRIVVFLCYTTFVDIFFFLQKSDTLLIDHNKIHLNNSTIALFCSCNSNSIGCSQ